MLIDLRCRRTTRVLEALAFVSLFGLSPVAASGAGQARTPRPTDRGMFVSVLDKAGTPVTDLVASDFVVKEDGVAREVLDASKADGPITFTLLVDTSMAAQPYVADMRRALTGFVKRWGGKNPMAVWSFGDRPTAITDYTLDVASLTNAVDRIFSAPDSGAYLLETVVEACKRLAKREAERSVIIAISAGGPEFSNHHFEELLTPLASSGASFYDLDFDQATRGPGGAEQRNQELFVDAGTRASGGERIMLLSGMALEGALTRLGDQLANQYRLTYARPDRLIPPEKTEVSVRRPGLTARGTPIRATKA
jgi:VWFA-related protein